MLEFDAALIRLPGKIAWTVFCIPASFTETVGTKGRINVSAVVDGAEFQSTLLPSSKGHYMVYNQAIRKHCGKGIGETVHVLLKIDDERRELVLPDDVERELSSSEVAMERFISLPYYMRREEINKINAAKALPTREKRIKALIDKLLK